MTRLILEASANAGGMLTTGKWEKTREDAADPRSAGQVGGDEDNRGGVHVKKTLNNPGLGMIRKY
jgi:hypothetical protein